MSNRHARTEFMSLVLLLLVSARCSMPGAASAQPSSAAVTADTLIFDTWVPGPCSPNGQPQGQCPPGDLFRVRLVAIAEGLRSPRQMAFTPDGDLLITELAEAPSAGASGNQAVQRRQGQVRIVRRGALAPLPLAGWPAPSIEAGALQSVIVHPQFASNRWVYLYYIKKRGEMSTRALARARLDGDALREVQEIFESDS
jgi:glucose/arabinose dehydrogenase